LLETLIDHAIQTLFDVQFLHQALGGRWLADVDQLVDVPEFLPSLLICGSARFSFRDQCRPECETPRPGDVVADVFSAGTR
jgi:hypothetical protein